MRLYNQVSCTPSGAASNAVDKNPSRQATDQAVSVKSSAWTMQPVYHTETAKSKLDRRGMTAHVFPAINFFDEDEAAHSPALMRHQVAALHIQKSGTGATTTTADSTHNSRELLFPSMYRCDTDGSLTSIIALADKPAPSVFEPFHFDIEVVKSAEVSQQENWGETHSCESSSTLSSWRSNYRVPSAGETLTRKTSTHALDLGFGALKTFASSISTRGVAGKIETRDTVLPDQTDCWHYPFFVEPRTTDDRKEKPMRHLRTKERPNDNLWIDFGLNNDFSFIESSHAEVSKVQSRETRRHPYGRGTPGRPLSSNRSAPPSSEDGLRNWTQTRSKTQWPASPSVPGDGIFDKKPASSQSKAEDEDSFSNTIQKRSGDEGIVSVSRINQEKPDEVRNMMHNRDQPFSARDQASQIKDHDNKTQLSNGGIVSADTRNSPTLHLTRNVSYQSDIDPPGPSTIKDETSPAQKVSQTMSVLMLPIRSGQAVSASYPGGDTASTRQNVKYSGSKDLLSKMLEKRAGSASSAGTELSRPGLQTSHRNEILNKLSQNRAKDVLSPPSNEQESASRSMQLTVEQTAIASTKSPPKLSSTLPTTTLLSNMLQKKGAPQVTRPTPTKEEVQSNVADDLVLSDDDFVKQLNEKSHYAKYARMLKVGLPLEAVKNAMERDGMSISNAKTKKQASVPHDPIERFRIHWQTHNNARSNTMWAMISREDHWLNGVVIDKDEMVSLFEKERNQQGTKNRSNVVASEGGSAVRVVDPKRANNCGIILARIKLSYREIATAIDKIDSTALTLEQINGIAQYLPTKDEACALAKHIDDAQSTQVFKVECEKFMAEILRVKHVEKKLDAMLFMKRVPISIEELKGDARTLRRACEEIMNSSSLRKILGLVLHLGNTVNAAGAQGKSPASAIQLSSLLKLNQAKTFDKKTTFLEFVAIILRRSYPALLDQYRQEMPTLLRAEKIQWNESVTELQSIDENLADVRRMALRMTLSLSEDGMSEDSSGDDLLAKLSADEEVRLLQATSLGRFTLETCLRMESVYAEMDAAKTVFDQIVHYFGEIEDKHMNGIRLTGDVDSSCTPSTDVNPQQILSYLSKFCNDLDIAVERAISSEKEKSRELCKRVAEGQQSPSSAPTPCKHKSVLKSRAKARKGGMKDVLADLRSRGKPQT